MNKLYSIGEFFANNGISKQLQKALAPFRGDLSEYAITLNYDDEEKIVRIKFPTRYFFRFCDKMVQQFAYKGVSFDKMIIEPKYRQANGNSPADNVVVVLQMNEDPHENRLRILFKR